MAKDLAQEFGRLCEREFRKVLDMERDVPEYMRQEDFETCEERAVAMISEALKVPTKVVTMTFAKHRMGEKHNEDRQAELDKAADGLDPEDASIGLMSFWNH